MNAERIWRICEECAGTVWRHQPTEVGIKATARMLFGTAAQESSLLWERQQGPAFDGLVGGFSKWQLERGSVMDSLRMLRTDEALCSRATRFLFHDKKAPTLILGRKWGVDQVLDMMTINDNDYLGCLFGRLHYLRVPVGIPCDIDDQAAYWKKHFNTVAGKGTVEQYIANWNRLCKPVVGEW